MDALINNISPENLLKVIKKSSLLMGYSDIKTDVDSNVITYTRPHSWIAPLEVQITILESDNNSEIYFVFPNKQKLGLSASKQIKNAKTELIENIKKLHNQTDKGFDDSKTTTNESTISENHENISIEKKIIESRKLKDEKSNKNVKYFFIAVFAVIGLFYVFLTNTGHKYDSYQQFADETSELEYFSDIVDRFGVPDNDLDVRDFTYYTVYYENITVIKRGKKKNVFWQIDRDSDLVIGSGLD